jgi:multimeric flavodoxin WrbA
MTEPALTALVINCTLKSSPAPSSSGKLASELMAEFEKQGVTSTIVRAADYTISPGVEADMGNGDQWPEIRTAMLDADILVIATPTWMGHMSSIAQRVLERLDAELSETDEGGRYRTYGKVAAAVIVGNEDGAHAISAALFQTLNDVGFSLAPNAVTYWNGEALGTVDYTDLDETPEGVASATHMVASNAAHLAALLHEKLYPPLG